MSLHAATWFVVLLPAAFSPPTRPISAPSQGASSACDAGASGALDDAIREVDRGAYELAVDRLRGSYDTATDCRTLTVAAWSARGWLAAQDARRRGGTPEALAEVRQVLTTIEPLGGPSSLAAYAVAVLRAASAAAQDERDELALWLEHARGIAEPLEAAGAAPQWPLPIERAEGELWIAVHDYELAETAFTRALATRDSPAAWRGLARARAGRNRLVPACEAYRRMLSVGPDAVVRALVAEAQQFLEGCPR
jgi:hypothetical protein